jgi:hypothetical protein
MKIKLFLEKSTAILAIASKVVATVHAGKNRSKFDIFACSLKSAVGNKTHKTHFYIEGGAKQDKKKEIHLRKKSLYFLNFDQLHACLIRKKFVTFGALYTYEHGYSTSGTIFKTAKDDIILIQINQEVFAST